MARVNLMGNILTVIAKSWKTRPKIFPKFQFLGPKIRPWVEKGYIDVGDGCWRPNVLVTSLRC